MNKIFALLLLVGLGGACVSCNTETQSVAEIQTDQDNRNINTLTIASVKELLKTTYPQTTSIRINRGVEQVARLWKASDGSDGDFKSFCEHYFVADDHTLQQLYERLSLNFETLFGHFSLIDMRLKEAVDLSGEEISPIDRLFSGYNVGAHLTDDLYANRIAFVTALNFPAYTLAEKNNEGRKWTRRQWAYARMGELFQSRVPADVTQRLSVCGAKADEYISSYNIYVGELIDRDGKSLFPKGMCLLSHWNLRDEIKSNYADTVKGYAKQQAIAQVMIRIVDQTIPTEVINNDTYRWNPFTNEIYQDKNSVSKTEERNRRYQYLIDLFAELKRQDSCYTENNTYIKRKFNGEMEIAQEEVEQLFVEFLSSPLKEEVGRLISKRLRRPLEPFDIWYDGFKSRGSVHPDTLNKITKRRYPNAKAFNERIPSMLQQLGFGYSRANEIAAHITVDAARGSGHARGAAMRGDTAHLRTRIGADGMDYKGFNIAVHELGHNVEQTISLYNIDHYLLYGVPNTSFTEALAFMFQSRDLRLLDIHTSNREEEKMKTFDTFWALYEIMGVSLVDIRMWKWLYNHPTATADELKFATLSIAKEVWNQYYAPVFGQKDYPILAIYSHMISYPLYMSAYAFGHIIHYQLESKVEGHDIARLVDRVFCLGRFTPDVWMHQAIGEKISIKPILQAVEKALN